MKIFSEDAAQKLFCDAKKSDRNRVHYLLHDSHNDKVQRLVIALKRYSYIEPHSHVLPNQWESFVVLVGQIRLITFSDNGVVLTVNELNQGSIVELEPKIIHTLISISEESLIYELKEGPFIAAHAKNRVKWAAVEGTAMEVNFVKQLYLAKVGTEFSSKFI